MIYAVADIHGYLAELEHALDLIAQDGGPEAPVVFLGDYVDRGPQSAAVLAHLRSGQQAGRPWICLRGNHDQMFLDYLRTGALYHYRISSGKAWTHPALGGRATLSSYGLSANSDWHAARHHVPEADQRFLSSLPLWHRHKELLFVHAGLRPGLPAKHQTRDDLTWIREPFLSDPALHEALIVHGHTALDTPTQYGNRVNLDGGAGYGRPLRPAVFEGRTGWLLTETGRVPIPMG